MLHSESIDGCTSTTLFTPLLRKAIERAMEANEGESELSRDFFLKGGYANLLEGFF